MPLPGSDALNPIDFPLNWDEVEIGGVFSPGLAIVGEFPRKHSWDIKKGKGSLGAEITFTGREPAKGSITFVLWTAQHFRDWAAFRAAMLYDPTKKSVQAVDIYHPGLADVGITSVVVESVGNVVHQGQGRFEIKVDLLEYFPPPPKSATSSPTMSKSGGAVPGSTPGTLPDPVGDAQQKEIAALLKTAEAA